MRADKKTYKEVAQRCSEFSKTDREDSFTNSTGDSVETSCVNCNHFDDDHYCVLDLYDKIVDGI